MPRERILELAGQGHRAAELLAGTAIGQRCFDWQQHRWTRYHTSMSKLEEFDLPGPQLRTASMT
jgi:hypothetical protein